MRYRDILFAALEVAGHLLVAGSLVMALLLRFDMVVPPEFIVKLETSAMCWEAAAVW